MGRRHYRLTVEDALTAHAISLEYGGGRDGVIDFNRLAGALGRPYHGYYRPIHRKCAALLHGLATCHAFVDANKRTAWLTTFILIDRSGYFLFTFPDDEIDDVVVDVVDRKMSQEQLELWFRERLVKAG